MTDSKAYRLITVGHWLAFCLFGLLMLATIFAILNGENVGRDYIDFLTFDDAPLGSLSVYCYPVMLAVQYIFEGRIKWFPWER